MNRKMPALPTILLVLLTVLPSRAADHSSRAPETTIWFDTPAKNFTESVPLEMAVWAQ